MIFIDESCGRMWEIIKMSFRQVAQVLASAWTNTGNLGISMDVLGFQWTKDRAFGQFAHSSNEYLNIG